MFHKLIHQVLQSLLYKTSYTGFPLGKSVTSVSNQSPPEPNQTDLEYLISQCSSHLTQLLNT